MLLFPAHAKPHFEYKPLVEATLQHSVHRGFHGLEYSTKRSSNNAAFRLPKDLMTRNELLQSAVAAHVQEGDCMYIPPFWHHAVLSHPGKQCVNIMVNFWGSNTTIDAHDVSKVSTKIKVIQSLTTNDAPS